MREYYFKVEHGVKGLEFFRVEALGIEEAIYKIKEQFNNNSGYSIIYLIPKELIEDSQKIQDL